LEFKQTDSNGKIDNDSDSYSKTKGCFVSDLTVGAEYSFTEKLALGLDLGYRFASKPKISDDIELDFSGLTSALSLNYKF
jgi:outer membrane scaffolding protein for murein synthesis (MipA/OmpV family)